jgi:hypothetical protein
VPDLATLAGPAATIIAASVAVYFTWRLGQGQLAIAKQQATIATQQAKLADIRLQHDLFDRRYAVYEAAQKLLFEVLREAKISDVAYDDFVHNSGKSIFLLSKELSEYIGELRANALKLLIVRGRLADPGLRMGDKRTMLAQEEGALVAWFTAQFTVLVEKFTPILSLDRRQASSVRAN